MNTLILATLLCALSVAIASTEPIVFCYYGTWAVYRPGNGRYGVDNINSTLCTHLSYTFNGIYSNGTVRSLDPYLDLPGEGNRDNYRTFNALKNSNPNLKTLLSIGGWNEGSRNYSLMVATPETRRNFVESSLAFVLEYGFDGVDVDWEYPARRDSVYGQADVDNFSQLTKELREAYDKHNLLVTAAVSSIESAASLSYDIPAISKYLDFINVMAYDLYIPSESNVTNHHAALSKGEGYENVDRESVFTVDVAIEYWLRAGCPPEKIILGVPFYGHTYVLADPAVNGLRAPTTGPGSPGPITQEAGTLAYHEICVRQRDEEWTIRTDEAAKARYAFRDNFWVTYDDAESIRIKAAYAASKNLGGVMTWSLESDDFNNLCGGGPSTLLVALNEGVGRQI